MNAKNKNILIDPYGMLGKVKTKPTQKESSLQISVCNYLRLQYPNVLFTCDLASGMKLTLGQAMRAKLMRSSKGWPDIFIAHRTSNFGGLFIELKREGEKIYKKDCTPVNDHIAFQIGMHIELQKRGYVAEFAIGFDQAKLMIDNYLKY